MGALSCTGAMPLKFTNSCPIAMLYRILHVAAKNSGFSVAHKNTAFGVRASNFCLLSRSTYKHRQGRDSEGFAKLRRDAPLKCSQYRAGLQLAGWCFPSTVTQDLPGTVVTVVGRGFVNSARQGKVINLVMRVHARTPSHSCRRWR